MREDIDTTIYVEWKDTELYKSLKAVKNNANIPVITKLADAKNKLDETGNKILSHELASSFLYRQAVWCKFHETLPDEFRAGIVII